MSVMLTPEQQDIKDLVRSFMENEVKPHIKEYDESGEFPVELYKKGFELGFHLLDIPEEFGGSGLDHKTMVVALEEMGRVEPAYAITMLCTSLALECVLLSGTKEQIKLFSDRLVPGSFGCFCLTEPNSGSDAASLKTTAVRDGDHYILNGRKCWVTNGGYGDVFVVFATVDRSLGAKGITAFLVEKEYEGLTVGKHEHKMGLRLSNTCDIALNNVRVPVANRLGNEGDGFKIAMKGLDQGRTNNAAIATGLSQAALEEALKYGMERVQFGKPILHNQALQFMVADMAMYTEAGRQLVHNAAAMLDAGLKATKEASMAKAFCGDNAVKVTTDAVQIFGGYGYSKEYPVEKMMRDSKIFQIFEGTNQIQRMVIAGQLMR